MNEQQPLTEEEYQQLLALGQQNADLGNQVDMQMRQADLLRGSNMPKMREARGIPVAPGVLETLSGMAASGVMGSKMNQAQAAQAAQGANSKKQNEMILRALLNLQQQRQQQGPAGPGMVPPGPQNPYKLGDM